MLTPLDIENKRFSKQMMNGYSVEEVDDFLDEVGVDYAKKNKELNEAAKKIEELNKQMAKYTKLEGTLHDTLVVAQTTAEEVKRVAKEQADKIVADTTATAQKKLDDIDKELTYKKKSLEDLQKQFDIYKAKMESLLISQLELIKEVNKED